MTTNEKPAGKVEITIGNLTFSAEGSEAWLSEQLAKVVDAAAKIPAATLQPREIEQVVDFLFAKVVGKGPMNHAACVEFWGSDVEACKEFPQ